MRYDDILRLIGLFIPPVMWALIILPSKVVINLYSTYYVAFVRFLVAGIISFLTGIALIVFTKQRKINIKTIIKDSIIPSILLAIHVISYYMAFALTGAILTEVLVCTLPIVIVTIAEHYWGEIAIPPIKAVYVTLLTLSGVMTVISLIDNVTIDALGVTMIFVSSFSWCFLIGYISEMEIEGTEKKKLTLVITRFGIDTILTSLFLIPTSFVTIFIPGWIGEQACAFIRELVSLSFLDVILDLNMLSSIFLNTLLPYFALYITGAYWKRNDLSYIQATSIVSPIEPITAAIAGWIILKEPASPHMMIFTIALLIVSLAVVYIHEVHETLLTTIIINTTKHANILNVFKNYSIYIIEMYHVLGTYNYVIKMRVKSFGHLRKIQGIVAHVAEGEWYDILIHKKTKTR